MLTFSRAEIKRIFDRQLSRMFRLIDSQMDKMSLVAPGDRIVGQIPGADTE